MRFLCPSFVAVKELCYVSCVLLVLCTREEKIGKALSYDKIMYSVLLTMHKNINVGLSEICNGVSWLYWCSS